MKILNSIFILANLLLRILKAGGIFSYLDPELPKLRQDQLLTSAMAKFILTDNLSSFNINWKITNTTELLGINISILKFMDKDDAVYVHGPKLAYIIHTSGSTGQGKVVQVPHGCIIPNITDLRCLKFIFIYLGENSNIH